MSVDRKSSFPFCKEFWTPEAHAILCDPPVFCRTVLSPVRHGPGQFLKVRRLVARQAPGDQNTMVYEKQKYSRRCYKRVIRHCKSVVRMVHLVQHYQGVSREHVPRRVRRKQEPPANQIENGRTNELKNNPKGQF